MTLALRWSWALSASALVGMCRPLGCSGETPRELRPTRHHMTACASRGHLVRRACAHYLVRIETGGLWRFTSLALLWVGEDSSVTVTPAIRHFLDELEALLDTKQWPTLDRNAVTVTPGRDTALAVLPHARDPALAIECEIDDRTVRIAFRPKQIQFTRRDEA